MNTKLFVRNLSWSVTEAEVLDLFSQVGSVLRVTIPTRREDGKPRGFAFVEMATPEGANQAIQQLHGTFLHNRDLVVAYQEDRQEGATSTGAAKNPKLFVRNVDASVSESDLVGVFSRFGQVMSARIPTDRDTGGQKPFAFVEMGSVDEASSALEGLNNTEFRGKTLLIDYQDPNRSKARPAYNRGGHGGSQGGYRDNRSGGGYASGW